MQKRAERFGTVVAPVLTAVEEDQKKEKRRERFGMTTTELPLEVNGALPCDMCMMVCVIVYDSLVIDTTCIWFSVVFSPLQDRKRKRLERFGAS